MKAYDDGNSIEFLAGGDGGGVQVDLGQSDSFDLRLTKFDTGEVTTQDDLLTRTFGPIRGLTNRPPPPFLDAMLLHATPAGVDCSADFSNLESPTVHVLIYNGGVLVAERTGVPGQLGQPLFTLPEWPATLGKLGGATPCRRGTIRSGPIRLPGSAGFAAGGVPAPEEIVIGDEFRVLAEMPPGTPHPDYYSGFEFIATEGADWGISDLQSTPACAPASLTITPATDGVVVEWLGDGFRLQGAEDPTGPWFDLGVSSPMSLGAGHAARFFRLVCD